MTNEKTLFSRYKDVINALWNNGERNYTANTLNALVGSYEKQTYWKRWNNNPYYTTRTYQSALKHLGCITKIKRGLWQINGPIPEWFGSFHINALSSKYALKDLEDHSIYWMGLPEEHKVNPWKDAPQARIEDVLMGLPEEDKCKQLNNTNNVQTMNRTTDCILQTITGTILIKEFPQLTMNTQVSVSPAKDGKVSVDICDWTFYIVGKEVSSDTAMAICSAYDTDLKTLYTSAHNHIAMTVAMDAEAEVSSSTEGITKDGARYYADGVVYYSKSEVMEILKDFANGVTNRVSDAVESALGNINADDVVELDWDSWNKTMDVSLDIRGAVNDVTSEVKDAIEEVLDGYEIDSVQLS